MRQRLLLGVAVLLAVAFGLDAHAQSKGRVEVIEARGVIDGSVERALIATIDRAEREDAALVIVQLDSRGVVDQDRATRLLDRFRTAKVPLAAWVVPAGRAENMAAVLVLAADIGAMAPSARIGPIETADLRSEEGRAAVTALEGVAGSRRERIPFEAMGADEAEDANVVEIQASTMTELLEAVDGKRVLVEGGRARVRIDPDEVHVRVRKLDLFGRVLHAAAQPSITYLLLLLALVGIVFELFHPSTGPAGLSGLAALALAVFGMVTLGGSWFAFALIVAGVGAFCVDLRYETIGPFTVGGLIALVSGSLLLFRGPWLRVSPWVLAFGIVAMLLFLLGAMTRVLRDLRAIARGELEVTDAHPHPNGQGGAD